MQNFGTLRQPLLGTGARRKFPLTPIRVLAPGSLHPRPSPWPPIDMSENFLVHVSAGRNLLACTTWFHQSQFYQPICTNLICTKPHFYHPPKMVAHTWEGSRGRSLMIYTPDPW